MTMTASPVSKPAPPQPPTGNRPIRNPVLVLFASMKLTVVLLVLLAVLTLFGTLAQESKGLYEVQRDYFESLFVVHDTGIPIFGTTLKLPLPGGYLLMAALFVNLLVGGVVRHRWRLRNAGILVTHLGMALLLIAGFVKMHFSFAGHVALFEGREAVTMTSFHDYEVALVRVEGDQFFERTIPAAAFAGAASDNVTVDQAELPFRLEFSHWLDNCEPMLKGPMFETPMPVVPDGDGPGVFLRPREPQKEHERNIAGCYLTVTQRDSAQQHRGILWGGDFRPFTDERFPFTFEAGGSRWGLDLRRVIWDLPFGVRLDKFQKTDHPGTMTPRDFSSWVTVLEGAGERKVHIYMNAPLRKDGYVFFQTNWGPQPGSRMTGPPWWSVFEVAKNPSDKWPELASYVVLIGLPLHFIPKLFRHLNSSNRRAALQADA